MSTPRTIAFIGAGNMANAIIGGMLENGFNADNLWVSAPDDSHLQRIRKQSGVSVTTDNRYCAQQADIIVLAVKPQIMRSVCEEIAPVVQNTRPLIVSIAAGLEVDTLDGWLGGGMPIVRCMPNTPSLVGKGSAGLYATDSVGDDQRKAVTAIFEGVGIALWVPDEAMLHSITALSGSAPAYFFLMLEAMEEAGDELGVEREQASRLAIQTMAGAAEMARRGPDEPAQLKRNVMSPGGTTEKAVETFEDGDLRGLVRRACQAVIKHSKAMAAQLRDNAS
ncbi:pyrroline-5-carboxylate reductase [Tamilnaduibacter salinus]|uniref:Pyrroline-5-carboxylate reductase n=1 Tax=Tamilnaduibacter salinus TaxID=1484056 RepID=A0A2A2I2U1_9GAMM|nr:pyrroline-5-carboxylate reductase [Tamilnaduibacter salinus]PAV25455.1 pyrroline-5-carboxylate reductase [Tamilnaduibacter salinus]